MRTPFDRPQQAPVVSEEEWFWASFILMLPLVNLLIALVWVLGKDINPSKVNYGRAIVKFYGCSCVMLITVLILADRSGYDYSELLRGASRVLAKRLDL